MSIKPSEIFIVGSTIEVLTQSIFVLNQLVVQRMVIFRGHGEGSPSFNDGRQPWATLMDINSLSLSPTTARHNVIRWFHLFYIICLTMSWIIPIFLTYYHTFICIASKIDKYVVFEAVFCRFMKTTSRYFVHYPTSYYNFLIFHPRSHIIPAYHTYTIPNIILTVYEELIYR